MPATQYERLPYPPNRCATAFLSCAETVRQTLRELFEDTLAAFVLRQRRADVEVEMIFDAAVKYVSERSVLAHPRLVRSLPFDSPFDGSTALLVATTKEGTEAPDAVVKKFARTCNHRQGIQDTLTLFQTIIRYLDACGKGGETTHFLKGLDSIKRIGGLLG